jgi:mannosyl-glycoprotein endo-beta-N-acetylglucosaminidase
MGRFRKIISYIIIVTFFITLLPISSFADYSVSIVEQTDVKMVVYDENSETVTVFENADKNSEPLIDLEIGAEVTVVGISDQYSQVHYENIESQELIIGFIENQYLLTLEEYAELTTDSVSNEAEDDTKLEQEDPVVETNEGEEKTDIEQEKPVTEEVENDTDLDKQEPVSEEELNEKTPNDKANIEDKLESMEEEIEKKNDLGKVNAMASTFSVKSTVLEGIAIKDPTNMYEQPSRNSNVLRTFDVGKSLKYYIHSSDWYTSYVQINGKNTTIYIHKDDVVNQTEDPVLLEGFALKGATNMYEAPSRESKVLRTFNKGKFLKFYTFSDDWYRSNVTVDGKNTTIYIHKDDVELPTTNPELLEGIALKEPTNMYEAPSRESKVLRTFNKGKFLKFYTYSSDWYRSNVTVDGKNTTIYIHKDDLELPTTNPELLEGIALKDPTNMYEAPSKESKVLRTFNKGKFLKFYTYSSDWYRSNVIVDGKNTTIYIHKDDVELPTTNPELLEGIALKDPTNMYEAPSRESKVLRIFNAGKELKYYTYTSDWYFSYVTINGKTTTIYINKADVDPLVTKPQLKEGIAWKNPTNMYESPARSSKVLRTFNPGSILKFYTYSTNWYKSTTTVNGKVTTIYIHKSDIELTNPSSEVKEGLALQDPTNVYVLPSSSATVLKKYSRGSVLRFYDYSKNWYKSSVWVDGKGYVNCYIKKSDVTTSGIVINNSHYNIDFNEFVTIQANNTPKVDGQARFTASRELVAYYANPINFDKNSKEYFQFLDLSVPLNLTDEDAKVINEKILKGKHKLEGTAEVFIEAGKEYGVNALYLIAHALHETGNGTSSLAQGIKVNGKTVYNFFGYAAYDGSADGSGSTFAYNKGWFTPEVAIKGGIEIIANSYIYRDNGPQNTLYKMRWNPENPGHHQYATHVLWATAQTNLIYNYYQILGITQYVFDVPTFKNQPGKTKEPTGEAAYAVLNVPTGLTGTLTTNVNFRTYPNGDLIQTLPQGTNINIIGANGGWYKATYNGKSGWLSGDYVSVLNGLQVTASALNVRSNPSGTSIIIGVVREGEIVKAVLNSSGNYIKSGSWYQIELNNSIGWVSGSFVEELRR